MVRNLGLFLVLHRVNEGRFSVKGYLSSTSFLAGAELVLLFLLLVLVSGSVLCSSFAVNVTNALCDVPLCVRLVDITRFYFYFRTREHTLVLLNMAFF